MGVAQNQLNVIIDGEDHLSEKLKGIESSLIRSVGAISSAFATIKIGAAPIKAAGDFERELANVRKTTNFTTGQINELNDSLLKLSLSTDIAAIDLAKVAAAAGQQGLGKDGVAGITIFTDSVARMASVLDITADQAARDVGKILNIFKIPIVDVEKVSSAFNEVSNNSTARGKELLDIVKRIGDLAGTIDLKSSLGLAATGIDLGLNPEVIGTSFTKIFSKFRTESSKFAKLLGTTAGKDFTDALDNKDGVGALKIYLDKLRTLSASEQAKTIALLSGTGRIFGITTKLAQDTLNAVLTKNLANSEKGFESGLSSIREQGTVLNTLNAQLSILKNSFFKLAVDGGSPLLGRLKDDVSDLSKALQSDGVQSAIRNIAGALGDVIEKVVQVAKFAGGLNVNFNNFITVAKIVIGLKLAEYFGTVAASIARTLPGATVAIAQLTRLTQSNAEITAAAAAKVTAELERKAAGELTVNEKLTAARKARTANIIAAAEAETAVLQSQAAVEKAIAERRSASLALNNVVSRVGTQVDKAQAATKVFTDVRAEEEAKIQIKIAEQQRLAAARKLAHEQTLSAIEAEFRGQRSAASAVLRAELEATEIATYERTVQRAATTNATINAKAAAQSAELIRIKEEEAVALQLIANRESAALLAAQAKYSAATVALSEATAVANVAVATSGRVAAVAAGGFGILRLAIGAVATALGTAITFIITKFGPFALLVTILYSIADAFGLVDKAAAVLGPGFQKVTDYLGLTSETSRQAAVETEKLAIALQKQKLALSETATALEAFLDKQGKIDPKKLKLEFDKATLNTDLPTREKAGASIAALVSGATAQKDDVQDSVGRRAEAAKVLAAQIAEVSKKLDEANAKYQKFNEFAASDRPGKRGAQEAATTAKADAEKLTEKLASLREENKAYTAEGLAAADKLASNIIENYKTIVKGASGFVSEDSLKLITEKLYPLRDAEENYNKAKLANQAALAESAKSTPLEEKKRTDAVRETTVAVDNAKIAVTKLSAEYFKAKDLLIKITVDPAGKNAIEEAINFFSKFSARNIIDFVVGVQVTKIDDKAKGVDKPLAAAPLIGKTDPEKKPTGEGKGLPSAKEESEAEKLAKAQRNLAKAQAEAAAALKKENNNELLQIDQFYYSQGLLSIETYYNDRKKFELESLNAERTAKLKDIEALKIEQGKVKAGSKKTEIQAQIEKDKGALAVLDAKIKAVPDTEDRARSLDDLKQTESVQSDRALIGSFFGVKDPARAVTNEIKVLDNAVRVQLNALRANLGKDGITKEIIEDLQSKNIVEGVNKVFGELARNTTLAEQAAQRYSATLNVLRLQGKLTDEEIIVLEERRRKDTEAVIALEIEEKETLLETERIKLEGIGIDAAARAAQSTVVQEQLAGIEALKLKLFELKNTADVVAQNINKSLESGLATAFDEISNGGGVLASLKKFGKSIANTILAEFNKNIAQDFVKNFLGGGGNGGIGGFFSSILKGNNKDVQTPKGTANDPLHVTSRNDPAQMKLNAENGGEGSKDYVSLEDQLKGKDADATKGFAENLSDNLGKAFQAIQNPVGTAIGFLKSFLQSTLSDVFKSLQGGAGGAGGGAGGLGSLFSSLLGGGEGASAGTATFGGGSVADFAALDAVIFHSGGVVGASGGTSGAYSPAIFANATRYHTGGIAGLKPNEIPAVLQHGEEVLRADDPRHRDNQGGSGTQTNNTTINITTSSDGKDSKAEVQNNSELGKVISRVVIQELQNQKRPGGLLS